MVYTVKLNNGKEGMDYLDWEKGMFSCKEDAVSSSIEESNNISSKSFVVQGSEFPFNEIKELYFFQKDCKTNGWIESK